jgi:hypothetical protein
MCWRSRKSWNAARASITDFVADLVEIPLVARVFRRSDGLLDCQGDLVAESVQVAQADGGR